MLVQENLLYARFHRNAQHELQKSGKLVNTSCNVQEAKTLSFVRQ